MKLGFLLALPVVALVGCGKGGGSASGTVNVSHNGKQLVDSNGACTGNYLEAYNRVVYSARDVKSKADSYQRTGHDYGLESSVRELNNACVELRSYPVTSCLASDPSTGTSITAKAADHDSLCDFASETVQKLDNARNSVTNPAPVEAPEVPADETSAPMVRTGDEELVSAHGDALRLKVLNEGQVGAITHDSDSTPNAETLVAVNGGVARLETAAQSIRAGKAACWVTNMKGTQLTGDQTVSMASDQLGSNGSGRLIGLVVSEDLVVMCMKSSSSQFTMGEVRTALENILEVTVQE